MNAICTNILQSKKLIEIGLDIKTADMHYMHRHWEINEYTIGDQTDARPGCCPTSYNKDRNNTDHHYIPCWSLGALIDIIPSMIYKGGETFTLMVHKDVIYHVCYKSHYHLDEIWFSKENLLDAAFEMVCWLLENGYIKKGE